MIFKWMMAARSMGEGNGEFSICLEMYSVRKLNLIK